MSIAFNLYNFEKKTSSRILSWYFLVKAQFWKRISLFFLQIRSIQFSSNYFFYGKTIINHFNAFFNRNAILQSLVIHHRLLSFSLHCFGFIWFVLSLERKHSRQQFALFMWIHVTLLVVVVQTNFILQNIYDGKKYFEIYWLIAFLTHWLIFILKFEGLILMIVPIMMVNCNDAAAYIFGFFFGKTPLIQLSPKKTWEGFIGGGISTLVFGFVLSYFLCQHQFFVCPVKYSEVSENIVMECDPSHLFKLQEYGIQIVRNTFWINNTFNLVNFREALKLSSNCIHSCGTLCLGAFLALLLHLLEVSSRQGASEHLMLK